MARRLVVLMLLLCGCKGMGGLGHAMGGLGHAMSGMGHAAGGIARVAGGVGNAVGHAAVPVARATLDAASIAVRVGEPVAEALASRPVVINDDPPVIEPDPDHDDAQDLCLDCPDRGNCQSCESGELSPPGMTPVQ
jgi:hypothetical protein